MPNQRAVSYITAIYSVSTRLHLVPFVKYSNAESKILRYCSILLTDDKFQQHLTIQ